MLTTIILSPSGFISDLYSLHFSVLPYFGQWIYISFITRGKKKILQKNRYWIKGHFSLGSDRPIMLLTPSTDLGGKSVVLLLTVPWQQAYQPQVSGVLRSLTPSGTVSCAGPRSISHLRLLGISGPIISILDSGRGWGMIRAFSSLLMATLRHWCCPSHVQCLLPLMFTISGYITLYMSLSLACVDFQVILKYSLRIQICESQTHRTCCPEQLLLPSYATAVWSPSDLPTQSPMTSSIPVSYLLLQDSTTMENSSNSKSFNYSHRSYDQNLRALPHHLLCSGHIILFL